MRFFILTYNDECRIIRCNTRTALSEINYAAFRIPYGPKYIGAERSLPLAIGRAREAGFKEVIVNDAKQNIEVEGVSGVI